MKFKVTVIIIVIGLILLLAVSVGVGAADNGGLVRKINLNADWASWLRQRLTQKVDSKAITVTTGATVGCRVEPTQLVVPENTTCQFTIQGSNQTSRQLGVTLTNPENSLAAVLLQENALSVEATFTRTVTVPPFDIYKNQHAAAATLTFSHCKVAANLQSEAPRLCLLEIKK